MVLRTVAYNKFAFQIEKFKYIQNEQQLMKMKWNNKTYCLSQKDLTASLLDGLTDRIGVFIGSVLIEYGGARGAQWSRVEHSRAQ